MARKTENQKLNESKDMPKVVKLTDAQAIARYGGENMLIAPPLHYDEMMKRVPFGMVTTSDIIRNVLAEQQRCDFTCPLTAGIFINTAARASTERGTDPTPFWRTLKKDRELNEKYPGGVEGQKMMLEAEGHEIIQRGKKLCVKNYADKLFSFE